MSLLSIDENAKTYQCLPCNRNFGNYAALLNHCRNASLPRDAWCDRCLELYESPEAYGDHLASSDDHHICLCDDETE